MAEPRFRFRIPWLGAAPGAPRPAPPGAPRPAPPGAARPAPPQPILPSPQTEPDQPVPSTPSAPQQPTFRPPGMASPMPARGAGFQIRMLPRQVSDSGTITQPMSPSQSSPRSQISSLSPPASPERKSPSPSRLPPVISASPPPPPALPTSPLPPPHQGKMESASLKKTPSPSMIAKLQSPAPSEKVIPETARVSHPTQLHEQGKGKEPETRGRKLEKGKAHKAPKRHHHHVPAKEEKKKMAMPGPSSYGKKQDHRIKAHHHQFRAPAGSSLSSPGGSEEPSLQKGLKEDVTKLVQKLSSEHRMKHQSGEHPVEVITLAGENRGASMQLSPEELDQGECSMHIYRRYMTKPDESIKEIADQETTHNLHQKSRDTFSEDDEAPEAYINSNVQGLNNSIIFDGSVTEGNPGVHIAMSVEDEETKPSQPTPDQRADTETRRSEFSPTASERLTYQPVIRRRCLRGLFMESSSDSDMDNPDEPRRHGCRYSGCILEKSEDKDINAL